MMRAASVQPTTLDRENRTFEVVWTTGATVRRVDFWDGPFYEELGIKKDEVRMGRLQNGAPFLDNHGFTEARGVKQVLGVVESAKLVSGKEGTALIRLSKRAEADGILDDIADGVLRNISVGYEIHAIRKVKEEDGVPTFRVTDWEPIELSLVPAGADDMAKVRNKPEAMREIEIEGMEEEPAPIEEPKVSERSDEDPSQNRIVNPDEIRSNDLKHGDLHMTPEELKAQQEKAAAEARAAEKKRISDIRATVSKVKLDSKLAEQWIEEDKSVEEVRSLVIEELAKKDSQPEAQTRSSNGTVEVGEDLSRKARIEGMTNAILHRHRPKTERMKINGVEEVLRGHELTEQGKKYAYRSLHELARMCLEENNFRTAGLTKNQIVEKAFSMRSAHSISDFSEILANTVGRSIRDGYLAAPQTWQPFTREVTVSDFKEISRTNLGDAPDLLPVAEGGEVERGTMSEAAEKYSIGEYARIVAITRKVIVNDDLNAMARIPEKLGRRAADLESDLVWNIIKANAALADTFALFSAQHGNLSTAPAAPSEAGLNEARAAMRRQTGLDGAEIALVPTWFYVPPAHETAAEKLVASIIPDSSSNVSPFSQSGRTPLRLAVEPRLETGSGGSLTAWFIFADLMQVDMLELARLEGTSGPQISTREGFDVAGLEIKIAHDVGAKAIDHRGMFKNAGA